MKKITISLFFIITASVLGLGWGLDSLFNQYQTQSSKEVNELHPYLQLGQSLASTLDKQQNINEILSDWLQQDDLEVSLQTIENFPLPAAIKDDFLLGKPLTLEFEDSISIHFVLPIQQKVLTLTLPQRLKNTNNATLQLTLTMVFYLGLLLFVFIWLYPLIKHLRQLRLTAKSFGEGNLEQRIKMVNTSYIADIETEFNRMAERIESLVNDNKLLSNAVSHDLRTPLARLRFGIEALQETDNPQTIQKYQRHLSRDIAEMETLVTLLLNYARLDQAMISIERREIDLTELVSDCVGALAHCDKVITWQPNNRCMISGDSNYLVMLINNVLNNAVIYATKQIKISVTDLGSIIKLAIEDDGSGIDPEQHQHILKPFSRGNNSIDKPGYGMGLAIAHRISNWHRAQLHIENSTQLGGASIVVLFNKQ